MSPKGIPSLVAPPAPPPLPSSLPRPPIAARAPPSPNNPSSSSLASKRAKMASQYGLADAPSEPYAPLFSSTTFKPCHMFFYGTLMDPEVLQRITRYPSKPMTRPGWITGFKPKMWYAFPTLIPFDELGQDQYVAEEVLGKGEEDVLTSEPSVKIRGMFWKVEDYQHFWELQRYETSAYRGHWCQIHVEDVDGNSEGENILSDGVVFVWAKNPRSPDLTDGKFDLAKWQKTHKSSLFTPNKY